MKNEIQKLEKQIRQLKRELLASEKKIKKLIADNKWAGGIIHKLDNKIETLESEIEVFNEEERMRQESE